MERPGLIRTLPGLTNTEPGRDSAYDPLWDPDRNEIM